jgi:hypothetical protein
MKFVLLFSLLFCSATFSGERADAFIVTAYNNKFKVLSPRKKLKEISVIIENQTLVKLIGQIISNDGSVHAMITIKPGKHKSVDLKFSKGVNYYFVPLSPSFQKVILDFGKEVYEIPSKK